MLILMWTPVFYSVGCVHRNEFAGPHDNSVFNHWPASTCSPQWQHTDTPTNSPGGFCFVSILTTTRQLPFLLLLLLLNNSHPSVKENLVFIMLSIFSYAYWSFVSLGKCLFIPFPHFLTGLFFCWLASIMSTCFLWVNGILEAYPSYIWSSSFSPA